MSEEAEPPARHADLELARSRLRQADDEAQKRRRAGAVRPGDDDEAAPRHVEVESVQDALLAVALLDRAGADHDAASARTKAKKTTLMTPFTVKKAASRRRRSPGRTSECS